MIVRFCGIAGDGIVTSGRLLAQACASIGLDLMVNDSFGAEIRGKGKSSSTIRFSSRRVQSMGDGIDALVAMAPAESILEMENLGEGGCVLYDEEGQAPDKAEKITDHVPAGISAYGIPLKSLANQATGSNQGRNLVAVGALCHLLGLPAGAFIELIRRQFKKKGDRIVEANLKSFRLGHAYGTEHVPVHGDLEIREPTTNRKIVTGNQALARGAIDCGLQFFGGYPITPATPIMEMIARELPKLGCWVHQAEDEIAAIGAVLGAFYAGKRAMTATSGPGLALMSEMINMAVMSEIPAVIVDVQRGGPATGLPTKVEQSDLNIALYGGAGDSPRVVMAPSTCSECYTGIQLAFDLAEKYQTPVLFLSDLFLANRVVTTHIEEKIDRGRDVRKRPTDEELKDYRRYRITPDGVSPLVVPGEEGAYYTITGLEHSEYGNPNYQVEVHREMTEKRFRKFDAMLADTPPAEIIGDEDAEIGFASWGSPIGAIVEGMEIARKQGIESKLIKSLMIHPQPEGAFRSFFASCRKIIIPEMNYQGQFAALMKSRYGIQPIEMHLPGVWPVSPAEIADKISEVHHEIVEETARVGSH